MEFKVTQEMEKYISLQRTGIKSEHGKKYYNEIIFHWETIKKYCKNIKKALDIGCGLSGIDYFLAKENPDVILNLLDENKIDNNLYYGFKQKACFYNDLTMSKMFLEINGINNTTNLYTPEVDFNIIGEVDLVISLISWGFHYPISTYLEKVDSIIKKDGLIIVDIRKEHIPDSLIMFEERKYKIVKISEFEKCTRYLFIK